MALLGPPAADRLDADTAALLDAGAAPHAHFNAVREIFAHFPAALKALDNQYDLMIGQGGLPRWLREAIFANASHARGDEYLADAMIGQVADHRDCTVEAARAMVTEGSDLSAAEASLLTWTRKMALTPYKSVERDADTLHEAGWTNHDIVEALTIVSLSAYMNIMSLTLELP